MVFLSVSSPQDRSATFLSLLFKKKFSLFKQNTNQPFILFPYPSLVIASVFCVHEFVFVIVVVVLDSTYKGDHMVFVLLCLTYFTYHNVLKAHLCCDKWKAFSLFFFLVAE